MLLVCAYGNVDEVPGVQMVPGLSTAHETVGEKQLEACAQQLTYTHRHHPEAHEHCKL